MVNKTSLLISNDFFHPELRAIYGDKDSAIEGYQRGEFAAWEYYNRHYFYGVWRHATVDNPMLFFLNRGASNSCIDRVDALSSGDNLLFAKALNDFYSDGVELVNHLGNNQKLLDARSPHFEWPGEIYKIVLVNGELHKKRFNLLEYQPLNAW